jgi:hypothetical protein
MPAIQVRPFRRADREQLTALVNAHIQAVMPGVLAACLERLAAWGPATGTPTAPCPHPACTGCRPSGRTSGSCTRRPGRPRRPPRDHPAGPGRRAAPAVGATRGVGTWLIGQAADWLRLARVDRLLAYAWPAEQDLLALLGRVGFRELTRTAKGWHHRSSVGSTSPEARATPGPGRP